MTISDETYNTVSKLILESEWGSEVTNTELGIYLMNEVNELIEGCNKHNYDNILEESSDVLMILLYIVIKNNNNQNCNLIDKMLKRLDDKLKSRYSVFFNEDSTIESEEEHWVKTKYLEKEIINYAFCPNPNCVYNAKTSERNIIVSDSIVKCKACEYTASPSSDNILFFRSKTRRKLLENLELYFREYVKAGDEFADEYFYSFEDDYIKVIRLWLRNDSSSKALLDSITTNYNDKEQLFNEFLLSPLRNYLFRIQERKEKINRRAITINDIIIKNINNHYCFLKENICASEKKQYTCFWIKYIQYLFLSIKEPIEYNYNYGISEKDDINSGFFEQTQNSLNYDIYVKLNDQMILITLCKPAKTDISESITLKANISSCRTITEIGKIILSVYSTFNLQNISKVVIDLFGRKKNINKNDLEQLLKDLMANTVKIIIH